jgi:hypothetical protein
MNPLHLPGIEPNFLGCPAHRLVTIVTLLSQVTHLLTHWINKIHAVKELLILELKALSWYHSSEPSGPILSQFDPFKIPPLSCSSVNTIPPSIAALHHKFVLTVQGQEPSLIINRMYWKSTLINWINRHTYTDNAKQTHVHWQCQTDTRTLTMPMKCL